MKLTVKDLALIPLFTALTAILAKISILLPFSPIPITMSLLGVYLSGIILGRFGGSISQVIYILLGLAGAPVFQGFDAGPAVVLGPKGGYILSYIIMAYIVGLAAEKMNSSGKNILSKRPVYMGILILAMLTGLALCYTMGSLWLSLNKSLSFEKALTLGVLPFIPLDLIKIAVSAVLGCEIRRVLLKSKLLPGMQQ